MMQSTGLWSRKPDSAGGNMTVLLLLGRAAALRRGFASWHPQLLAGGVFIRSSFF